MKKLLVLALVLVLGLVGCGKQQTIENQPTEETTVTSIMVDEQQVVEPTKPTETIEEETEPEEVNPYEEYISSTSKGKYLYEDLDGDGETELIIEYSKYDEKEIVTIVDGEPVQVMKENHLFLCEDGIIVRWGEGSGGSTVCYYRIDGQEALIVDAVMNLANDDSWYHASNVTDIRYLSYKTMDRITEEESHKICAQYRLKETSMPSYLTRFYGEE